MRINTSHYIILDLLLFVVLIKLLSRSVSYVFVTFFSVFVKRVLPDATPHIFSWPGLAFYRLSKLKCEFSFKDMDKKIFFGECKYYRENYNKHSFIFVPNVA